MNGASVIGLFVFFGLALGYATYIDSEIADRSAATDDAAARSVATQLAQTHAIALRFKRANQGHTGSISISATTQSFSGFGACADSNSVTSFYTGSEPAGFVSAAMKQIGATAFAAGPVFNNSVSRPNGTSVSTSCAVPNGSVAIKTVM